ncbi:MAG: hypothetical protein R3185_09605, partial [Candidatus Thermoplasmatota archaeon]|nr:hypothetical protein [Candidatus Thermoplasmatota archaeon]
MSSATRPIALFLVAIMLASLGASLAPSATAQAQGDEDVPVPYATAVNAQTLHLWRDEASAGLACDDREATAQATSGQADAICSLRAERPPSSNPADPDVEIMNVRQTADGAPDPSGVARFILDTDPGTQATEGTTGPFTIQKGTNAVKVSFWYDSEAVCTPVGGQSLTFNIALRQASADDLQAQGNIGSLIASTTTKACNAPGTIFGGSQRAHQVTVSLGLDQAVSVPADRFVLLELFAVNEDLSNAQWALLFEDATYDSRVEIRTPPAVEYAMWASDKAGTFQ